MQHLAHYLARQSGHPEHGDTLAALLAALQNAHEHGDTLIRLNDTQRAAAGTLATTPLLKKPLSLWERGWGEGLKP